MTPRPPAGEALHVDCVTRAVLGARDIDIGTILGSYDPMNGTGPGYETNVPGLVLRDEFGAPDLTARSDGSFATTSTYETSEAISLHGPSPLGGDSIGDPLVMVHHVNLSETAAQAAVGRRLREVVDTAAHPRLATLAEAVVTGVHNGDARPTGGSAYVHIHLDPAWRKMRMPDYTD